MTRPIPKGAPAFLIEQEGCVLRVYDDKHPHRISKPGDEPEGTWTAGVGHTGPDLHPGMTVTQEMSAWWLFSDLPKFAVIIEKHLGAACVAGLGENIYTALLAFAFNLGGGPPRGSKDPKHPEWHIWQYLRAGQIAQAKSQLGLFINWDGQPSAGLVKRRKAEEALWELDMEIADVDPPSSVTRAEPTPPTPIAIAEPVSKKVVAGGVGAAALATPLSLEGVGNAVQSVREQLDNIHGFHLTQAQIVGLFTLAAIFLVAIVLLKLWQHSRAPHP